MPLISDPVIAIGHNRSGQDSGELDYSLNCSMFDRLDIHDLEELRKILTTLKIQAAARICKLREEKK